MWGWSEWVSHTALGRAEFAVVGSVLCATDEEDAVRAEVAGVPGAAVYGVAPAVW
jgi:hypothetical protein